MKYKRNLEHESALEGIVNHPEELGLDKKKIDFILKEPQLFKYNSKDNEKCCDVIYGYHEPYHHAVLAEVKHDNTYSSKALNQLNTTEREFCNRIGYVVERKLIYYYPSGRIEEKTSY